MSEQNPGTPERQSTPFLVLQFFVFPLSIVAVCVAVFVVFGLIASEGRGARDYLAEVRQGGANRRWQAAFELAKLLQAGKDPALKDPRFIEELLLLFRDTKADDPRVRRYLALALGRLGDRQAVPALAEVLRESGPDSDSETVIFAAWALGALGDPAATPELARAAASGDAGVRKAAVHALGALPGEAAAAALRPALEDAALDVRWNAALALGRRRDPAALPLLAGMLDRDALERLPEVAPEQRDEALLQAVAVAAGFADEEIQAALARLRDADPNLRVRDAAREALAARAARPTP
ncbi:MAG: HEAT repeat domain-containing protein [Vicinamibacteria bacterium]